ncbi:hypothetical protein PT015_16150 [Candidatus Mycobacterium wuenschmannii]|uniref:Uncharacterized protein n=1 Tax=Candidatus Mycobacterium wuenschmannii TaxID=3027808 RepID=A0ABY8VS17_9MYCO|nr:hypothetical protein [Candidatus Mycobacterium wuenschmannii]WIM86430.1 hypothetical protein PT015_16150 [Candidatus Mycobacterium wuenschmannii]
MTVLGAVVFGGILALGVLWLFVTAPASDADQPWVESPLAEHDLLVPVAGDRLAH